MSVKKGMYRNGVLKM